MGKRNMKTSESIANITAALIKAQAEIKHAQVDAQNAHLKNKYATLESVIDAVKNPLLKNDIVILQSCDSEVLVTRLLHKSGEYVENSMKLLFTKLDMQGLGSAITYARRYSLASLCNISQADDDGNSTTGKIKEARIVSKEVPAKTSGKKNTNHF